MTFLAAAAAIAACSGGGGETPPTVTPPPPAWGQIDRTFGTDGRVLLASFFLTDPERMAVAGDGSVYVAGGTIEKVDRSGVLVASFGTGGSAPVLDEAGNLYVISGAGIAKLDSAGHPVPSFGSNGYATLGSWGGGNPERFLTLVRDSAGNLYLGGYTLDSHTGIVRGGVAKFDSDGHLVASFASSGVRLFEWTVRLAMAIDGGGNVFIAGDRLMKLDSSGNLAADFATGGFWEVPDCADDGSVASGASAVAIDATGNLVVGANCGGSLSRRGPLVFKLDAGGNVVASFRESGQRTGLFGTDGNRAYVATLLIGPSGHIYAAGFRDIPGLCGSIAVAKLDAGGDALPAFDASHAVILEGQPADFATDLGMDAAGRLYVGGVRMPVCPQPRLIQSTFVVYRLGA